MSKRRKFSAEFKRGAVEQWRQFYNEQRPHSSLRYRPPASLRRNWSETDTIFQGLTA